MYLVYLLLRLLALLPLRVLHGIGGGLGRLLLWRGGRTVRNTAVNLAIGVRARAPTENTRAGPNTDRKGDRSGHQV